MCKPLTDGDSSLATDVTLSDINLWIFKVKLPVNALYCAIILDEDEKSLGRGDWRSLLVYLVRLKSLLVFGRQSF